MIGKDRTTLVKPGDYVEASAIQATSSSLVQVLLENYQTNEILQIRFNLSELCFYLPAKSFFMS
jgi:hypothetical protein